MALFLLIALIGVPLIEIAVFIEVGGLIGLWPTLAVVVLTAVVGTWQLRLQGLATLGRARQQLDRGVLPTRELFDGLCLVVAGALLLTPGFVTDAVGLLLFLPAARAVLRDWAARRVVASAEARVWVDGEEVRPKTRADDVIEGDYQDLSGAPARDEEEERDADERRRLPR